MRIVYGPVPSWRLGRSLGVDLICAAEKTCSFDCSYCQLGPTKHLTTKRDNFVVLDELEKELRNALDKVECDVVTLSGTGEPTLAENLDISIKIIKSITELPVAILTNSSLMHEPDVREALSNLDIVVAKLDAPDPSLFHEINNPAKGISFQKVLDGIKKFRSEYEGKLAIQIMFIEANKDSARKLAKIAKDIKPDEVQINTPLRSSPVPPLNEDQIESIERSFNGLNTVSVYRSKKPDVDVLDKMDIIKRRGLKTD